METGMNKIAAKIRIGTLKSIHYADSGHPGGSLSIVGILVYLYFKEMNIKDWRDPNRDRFVLSKGHACPALYAVLAEKGFIEKKELWNLRKTGALLQGHPEIGIPGIEVVSGSLGQGFSAALGIALGAKRLNKSFRVYVILGDGECNEGQVWEGAMFGAFHKLDNLVAIVDYNNLQSDSNCDNVTALSPLNEKWKAFGWHVLEINGHDFKEIENAFKVARRTKGKPTCIIAHTIKGKGVSFMENNPAWHGSRGLTEEELRQALKELGEE
ncbi:transketolase [Hippea sp. KM1]|uniref:transketolase n=1 Tax=Hippea sp. KM1 TaxID=944481 RepID=UPI00046D544A|nr:transketolase [Hippea sp. KM1]